MPVKLNSQHDAEAEARIEIIPLIDIMFFLLAAFMLVSLSQVHVRSLKVNLPTAVTAGSETPREWVAITVDRHGMISCDRLPMGHHELLAHLKALRQTNAQLRVLITGDAEARHGDLIRVLDLIRSAGIQSVAFETRLATP